MVTAKNWIFRAVILATVMASVSIADETVQGLLNDPAYAKNIRTKYVRSNLLPDGVSFRSILVLVKALDDEDPYDADFWVQSNIGLEGNESTVFKDLLLASLESLISAERTVTQEMACEFGVPKASGEGVYPLFEAMDDAVDDLAAVSLDTLLRKLDADTAARLQQWLTIQKVNVVHVKFNHKEHYATAGMNADVNIANICIAAESTNGRMK